MNTRPASFRLALSLLVLLLMSCAPILLTGPLSRVSLTGLVEPQSLFPMPHPMVAYRMP